MEKSIFEQLGGTYTRQDDYLLPDLKLPEMGGYEIGIWGNRHRRCFPAFLSIDEIILKNIYEKNGYANLRICPREHAGSERGQATHYFIMTLTARPSAGELPQCLPALEDRENPGDCGGAGVRDAAVHFPLLGGDLRKIGYSVNTHDLQKHLLFCKGAEDC